MTSILSTIKALDEKRAVSTKGEWETVLDHEPSDERLGTSLADIHGNKRVVSGGGYDKHSDRYQGSVLEDDADYIVALHNNYEALRSAALLGEEAQKWKQAAMKLAEDVEKMDLSELSENMATEGKLELVHIEVACVNNNCWRRMRDAALRSYDEAMKEGV